MDGHHYIFETVNTPIRKQELGKPDALLIAGGGTGLPDETKTTTVCNALTSSFNCVGAPGNHGYRHRTLANECVPSVWLTAWV